MISEWHYFIYNWSCWHSFNTISLLLPSRVTLNFAILHYVTNVYLFMLVSFEENASLGKTTYVHCKAGRGRSTTIVLCYLVCTDNKFNLIMRYFAISTQIEIAVFITGGAQTNGS